MLKPTFMRLCCLADRMKMSIGIFVLDIHKDDCSPIRNSFHFLDCSPFMEPKRTKQTNNVESISSKFFCWWVLPPPNSSRGPRAFFWFVTRWWFGGGELPKGNGCQRPCRSRPGRWTTQTFTWLEIPT